jgi:hypothetical protein
MVGSPPPRRPHSPPSETPRPQQGRSPTLPATKGPLTRQAQRRHLRVRWEGAAPQDLSRVRIAPRLVALRVARRQVAADHREWRVMHAHAHGHGAWGGEGGQAGAGAILASVSITQCQGLSCQN